MPDSEYSPGLHWTQSVENEPTALENLPAEQLVQTVAPNWEEYVPALQKKQLLLLSTPKSG
jgi:hypothetical protein